MTVRTTLLSKAIIQQKEMTQLVSQCVFGFEFVNLSLVKLKFVSLSLVYSKLSIT